MVKDKQICYMYKKIETELRSFRTNLLDRILRMYIYIKSCD